MTGVIYKITNDINDKVYIGQTVRPIKERWYKHCSKSVNAAENNMNIKKAIFKYGKEHFTIDIIEICDTTVLNEREKYWIAYYDSYKNGYNMTLGGQDGAKLQKLLNESSTIIALYEEGNSLRTIAKHYNVDHATIKLILTKNNIALRNTRTYKLSKTDREQIIAQINSGVSRKEIMNNFHISKGYLSQLINGSRRI